MQALLALPRPCSFNNKANGYGAVGLPNISMPQSVPILLSSWPYLMLLFGWIAYFDNKLNFTTVAPLSISVSMLLRQVGKLLVFGVEIVITPLLLQYVSCDSCIHYATVLRSLIGMSKLMKVTLAMKRRIPLQTGPPWMTLAIIPVLCLRAFLKRDTALAWIGLGSSGTGMDELLDRFTCQNPKVLWSTEWRPHPA